MRIEAIRTIPGPNVYTNNSVLVARLNLEELAGKESREFEGFNEKLLSLLHGLHEHHCAKGAPGGFVERLNEGTFFGHIIEHVALELSEHVGVPVYFGKTREVESPNVYNVIVEYKSEAGMRRLLHVATELVTTLLKGETYPLEEKLNETREIIADAELGPSTRAIVEAAHRRGIPSMRLDDRSLVQLGWGAQSRLIAAAMTEQTSAIGVDLAGDKDLTKKLLSDAGIPVPKGVVARTPDEAVEAMEESGGAAFVVKPLDGRQGKGVSLNLRTPEEVRAAFAVARELSRSVLIEELYEGRNYRALVVNGKLVAASERKPCQITGDGERTIAELIEIENGNPLRGEGHAKPLTKIKIDATLEAHLRKQGIELSDTPRVGESVTLCAGINLSTGATARDVTDEVHASIARMCERAARTLRLDVCGVDLVLEDIAAPLSENQGGVIEINAAPGLRMHHFPSVGEARDAGGAIVDALFPAGANGRIPLISITGTNGKTTVTRMIEHVIRSSGKVAGMTTTDGVWIAGEQIAEGDTTGPHSARMVLRDPSVEVAVLETARGGIVRRGLGYDWSDIGVLTNIGADHIGQDGIETVEDIVHIKSLVAERVRAGGVIILNADDEHLARLTERRRVREPRREIVYFTMREDNPLVGLHIESGGSAYLLRANQIIEARGAFERRIVDARSLPATMGGTARFQIANALAAVAACRAYRLSCDEIASALENFAGAGSNPGRANLYRVRGGYVMVDYGHNPDAFKAVCQMAANWRGRRIVGIVGTPGDRDDSVIEAAGRVAARGFQRVVIKEDKDTRGRRRGEVAEILCRAVHEESPATECRVTIDEAQALAEEIERMSPETIIVIFYDKLAPILETLARYDAKQASVVELSFAAVAAA